MLKWLQLDSIHFLIAKQMIAHSLQLSAYLSVPHSFEAFNPNSDAISLSQLQNMFICTEVSKTADIS